MKSVPASASELQATYDAALRQLRGVAPTAIAEGVTLDDFCAYMPRISYIFTPSREMWPASSVNARVPPVQLNEGNPIPASAWLDQNRAGRANDVVPRPADDDPRSPDLGRWLDRAQGRHAVSTSIGRRPSSLATPPRPTPWLDHVDKVFATRSQAHRELAGTSGAATGREDQPRAGARRRAGHRQGHAPRAGEARGRAVEFLRSLAAAHAWAIQRLREVRHPAHQRGARSGRRQPLPVLRSHEGVHRRTAGRAARR